MLLGEPFSIFSAGYDEEARYFEDTVRRAKQQELLQRSHKLVHGAFDEQLAHLQRRALSSVVLQLSQPEAHQSFAASAARSAPLNYK